MSRPTCPAARPGFPHEAGSVPALCNLCAVVWAHDTDPCTRHGRPTSMRLVREETTAMTTNSATPTTSPWVRRAQSGTLPASDRTGAVTILPEAHAFSDGCCAYPERHGVHKAPVSRDQRIPRHAHGARHTTSGAPRMAVNGIWHSILTAEPVRF